MDRIDARGRSCPQPVIMTKAQVEKGDKEFEVLLDNAVSASNVRRFLESHGYSVLITDEDGTITIQATATGEAAKQTPAATEEGREAPRADAQDEESRAKEAPATAGPGSFGVLITNSLLGGSDPLLGEVLMKSMLGTLSQTEPLPVVVALMNEGVKLAVKHTSTLDHLTALEQKGVKILVCGTCATHFGLTDDIGTGVISNMFEIMDSLLAVDRVLTI